MWWSVLVHRPSLFCIWGLPVWGLDLRLNNIFAACLNFAFLSSLNIKSTNHKSVSGHLWYTPMSFTFSQSLLLEFTLSLSNILLQCSTLLCSGVYFYLLLCSSVLCHSVLDIRTTWNTLSCPGELWSHKLISLLDFGNKLVQLSMLANKSSHLAKMALSFQMFIRNRSIMLSSTGHSTSRASPMHFASSISLEQAVTVRA